MWTNYAVSSIYLNRIPRPNGAERVVERTDVLISMGSIGYDFLK